MPWRFLVPSSQRPAPSGQLRSQALCWGQSLGLGRQAVIEAQPGPGETLENPSDGQLCFSAFCLWSGWGLIPVNRCYSALCGHSFAGDYNYLSVHCQGQSSQVVENVIHFGIT